MKLKRGDLVTTRRIKFGTVIMVDRWPSAERAAHWATIKVVFSDGLIRWCSPKDLLKQ